MKNLKRTLVLFGAALCLFAACNNDSGEDLPGVNLRAPSPSALPVLAAGTTVVTDKTAALELLAKAVDPLMGAMGEIGGKDEEKWQVKGNAASRGLFSYQSDPIVYRNDKKVIPGAAVTGYVKGSFKSYSKDDDAEKLSPGDYTEVVEDAKFEVDLLEGTPAGDFKVEGRFASEAYVKMKIEIIPSDNEQGYDTAISSDIDEKLMYALAITDGAKNTGGRFILALSAKGKVGMDFGSEADLSNLNITATLRVYNNDNIELPIELDVEDIRNYLQLGN
jgi:hypothetical protein